jgi:3-methylcrotonyl-CoA carboxylase beta subunit
MAIVPLAPIGSPRDQVCDDRTFREYREALTAREQVLGDRRAKVHTGWGPKYLERLHERGKLSARGRAHLQEERAAERPRSPADRRRVR